MLIYFTILSLAHPFVYPFTYLLFFILAFTHLYIPLLSHFLILTPSLSPPLPLGTPYVPEVVVVEVAPTPVKVTTPSSTGNKQHIFSVFSLDIIVILHHILFVVIVYCIIFLIDASPSIPSQHSLPLSSFILY